MKKMLLYILLGILMACDPAAQPQGEQALDTSAVKEDRIYTETYPDGRPYITGRLVDGKRQGLWVSYHENGLKWSEENYHEGLRNGQTVAYYPSGLFRYKGAYVDDKREGLWTFYDEEGKVIKEEDFSKK